MPAMIYWGEPTVGADVFEGPEKKLEVFFAGLPAAAPEGFRRFSAAVWSDVLREARCTILRRSGNAAFDAYLLSESSLFVYPRKVVLKTCGTTTLLLVLPKLLGLAARLGARLEHVHYSHFRYAFPQLQPYPHSSFREEQRTLAAMLHGHAADVRAGALGAGSPSGGYCWYALCAEAGAGADAEAEAEAEAGSSGGGRDGGGEGVFEIAMEGLPGTVCTLFYGGAPAYAGLSGRRLAERMTEASGVGALLAGAEVDDWAFEPCGYSMNALRGGHYYTVHVTPEAAFSYASFETNDPSYATPQTLAAIVATFAPSTLTTTLTTRSREARPLPRLACSLYAAGSSEAFQLCSTVAVSCSSYERLQPSGDGSGDADLAESLADSESTCTTGPLDETNDDWSHSLGLAKPEST